MIELDYYKIISDAKSEFAIEKPEHFTNYSHCPECFEADEILRTNDVDSIGLDAISSVGDPLPFCSPVGKLYYTPAFIRISEQTMNSEFYLVEFLFALESDGINNHYYEACNNKQRDVILNYIRHVIFNYPKQIDIHGCTDQILRVHDIWSDHLI